MTKKNLYLFLIGVAIILIGFILLSIGPATNVLSLTVAPIVLTIGYLVAIPLALIYREKS